jgi:hypothetical protein
MCVTLVIHPSDVFEQIYVPLIVSRGNTEAHAVEIPVDSSLGKHKAHFCGID